MFVTSIEGILDPFEGRAPLLREPERPLVLELLPRGLGADATIVGEVRLERPGDGGGAGGKGAHWPDGSRFGRG